MIYISTRSGRDTSIDGGINEPAQIQQAYVEMASGRNFVMFGATDGSSAIVATDDILSIIHRQAAEPAPDQPTKEE